MVDPLSKPLRHERKSSSITSSIAGEPSSIAEARRSTAHAMRASGRARLSSAAAGSVCTTSPIELSFIMRIRITTLVLRAQIIASRRRSISFDASFKGQFFDLASEHVLECGRVAQTLVCFVAICDTTARDRLKSVLLTNPYEKYQHTRINRLHWREHTFGRRFALRQ